MSCFCFNFELSDCLRKKLSQVKTFMCGMSGGNYTRRNSVVADLDQINITGASLASSSTTSSSNTNSSTSDNSRNAFLVPASKANDDKNKQKAAQQLVKNSFLCFTCLSRSEKELSESTTMGNNFRKNKVATNSCDIRLTETELELLLKNTNMSREQLVEFHSKFLQDCPTGVLTKKEFVKMFQQLHPIEESRKKVEKFCEYVFKAIDKDSNNEIEFTDFVVVFSITSFGDLKEKINLAFKIYDLDKNGVIDKNEMFKVVEALYDLTGVPDHERKGEQSPRHRVEQMMTKLDSNNNKVIEFEEFFDGCMKDPLVRKILIDPMFNC